ncbi:hypothetical protein [Arthrobacter ginkgonis]|uniref:hypothetical protein n=1 Tax=Arthrobacter ginkgonis TaxID=1630594 RepID=UPI003CD063A0
MLGQFSDKAHGYALDKLTAAGVDVRLGVGVTAVHPDKVEPDDDTAIATRTVVWGGGVGLSDRPRRRPHTRSRRSTPRSPGPQRGRLPRCVRRRRGRQASPPGRGPGRLRRLARCTCDAAQRRAVSLIGEAVRPNMTGSACFGRFGAGFRISRWESACPWSLSAPRPTRP